MQKYDRFLVPTSGKSRSFKHSAFQPLLFETEFRFRALESSACAGQVQFALNTGRNTRNPACTNRGRSKTQPPRLTLEPHQRVR